MKIKLNYRLKNSFTLKDNQCCQLSLDRLGAAHGSIIETKTNGKRYMEWRH